MTPFSSITSVAAVLEEDDVDTDIIFPARFLLLLDKAGLGKHAFHERRHARAGTNQPFVFDVAPFDKARILIAGRNFGTGSSREQAVWALVDFGIRCIIASSFGEIFYANCFKNGVLPVLRTAEEIAELQAAGRAGEEIAVDLVNQTISSASGLAQAFDIDSFRKDALLQGLDEIGSIHVHDMDDIIAFEARQRAGSPWLYLDGRKQSFFDDLDEEKALE
ncbi:3-isopropylmalate dehydratase small subunit [Mesorhizobium sp. CN2-181]|uniref:3-isopropylmalate dehydratase small subunit n=1 Tax=Mesorhizobium yinganensis TaxID=3157707 RepID=UPI0032B7AF97